MGLLEKPVPIIHPGIVHIICWTWPS